MFLVVAHQTSKGGEGVLCTKQLEPSSPRASLGVNAEMFDCSLMLHRESKLANTVLALSNEEAVHRHTLQSGLSGTPRNLAMEPPDIKEMGQWCCQCHQWTVNHVWLTFGSCWVLPLEVTVACLWDGSMGNSQRVWWRRREREGDDKEVEREDQEGGEEGGREGDGCTHSPLIYPSLASSGV